MRIKDVPKRLRRLILNLLFIHNPWSAKEFKEENDEYFLNKNKKQEP